MTTKLKASYLTTIPFFFLAMVLTACTGEAPEPTATAQDAPPPRFDVNIRRTSYGIPHIQASDLESIGYGEGYAQAEDHLCTIADQVVRVRSERAKYFGAGEENQHALSDAGLLALNIYQRATTDLAESELTGLYEGFAAGYNRFLEETGKDNVPGWCQGQEWVVPIDANDIAAYMRSIMVIVSRFAGMIPAAQPPQPGSGQNAPSLAAVSGAAHVLATELGKNGSNGWALGSEWTESGNAMLLANPHYPWVGANRFWEKHLVIPGKLDVYGVSLIGAPGITIGFNEDVGWTHTVSAGKRFTLYSLELVPGSPTHYMYDGAEREMTSKTITVKVRQKDGSVQEEEHTIWYSHLGPILNFPEFGWTEQFVLTVRDANFDNEEGFQQWNAMTVAENLEEFQAAHANYQGMPWTNTIAASNEGTAWYADASATPYLSEEAINEWKKLRENDPMIQAMWNQGLVLLPGNDSLFEWQDHPSARDPGILPYEATPQIERKDYVFNANDSFWLANSSALITGDYSPLQGEQETVRSLRTRNNDITLSLKSPDQPAGDDGKFNLDEMAAAITSNRSYGAELLKPELLAACQRTPTVELEEKSVDLKGGCDILGAWDNRFDNHSRGAVLFREWIGQYPFSEFTAKGQLYAEDFDPADPVNTPRGLADATLALQNLARAVGVLESAGHAIDVSLGELQFAIAKTPRRIPVHGGNGSLEGILNLQVNSRNTTTLEPLPQPKLVEGSKLLTEDGYPVVHGSSFVMALEFTDTGPSAKAILSYSQSGDPESPHFTDQTELYSEKQWRPVLFREADIAADTRREYSLKSSE
jgi:acyl-homoserine-lactone acylase